MKVILVGKGEMLANLIQGCMLAGVEIVGVFRYERLLYSSLRLFFHDFFSNSPDLTLIRKFNLRDINCKSVNSEKFRNEILKTNTDIVLVGTWREKFKKETIDMPVIGTINVHPALLPKYRGPNPYLQTIWHREKESGVTFHLMDEKFDSGAVLAQAKVEILDEPLYYYFQRENSLTKKINDKVVDINESLEYIKNMLKINNIYSVYKDEFDMCIYLNLFIYVVIASHKFNLYVKKIYNMYKDRNIMVKGNIYIIKYIDNYNRLGRLRINIYQKSYKCGILYDFIRDKIKNIIKKNGRKSFRN